MSLSQKLNKLLKTEAEDNVKLATNIILQQVKNDNVIALICVLKNHRRFDILKQTNVAHAVNSILESKVSTITEGNINYAMPYLMKCALMLFKSKENIESAKDTYLTYINHLTEIALKEIEVQNSDDNGTSLMADDDELPL